MLSVFDILRELTIPSMIFRLLLAVLCGGIVGIEREFKGRPAGFRTHIFICLGAALTTITSQFLVFYMNYDTDLARIGAQAVAGMGFIGAGTIMITQRRRVMGLTTAAGLWTAAIVGLALGAGFYEGGILVTVLVILAELLIGRLEERMLEQSSSLRLQITYKNQPCLQHILELYKKRELAVLDMEVVEAGKVLFTLRSRMLEQEQLLLELRMTSGVESVDVLELCT